MLGEIRDFETAEVAFHAALTGHTVLSTLHTNSCIATITRLLDMGVKPYVISSALNGVISQRLVRRICTNCMGDDSPTKETLYLLGLSAGTQLPAKKGLGCSACNNTGYKDRTGIYEVFNINTEIGLLIQQQATEAELQKSASQSGIQTLFESGMEKIRMGITTCDEVLRVLGPQNLLNFKCRACGKMMQERYNFCPHCAAPARPRCSNCSRALESGWRACPDCGSLSG
jgi:type II secretory ATPase GspE/PulE/Tfp pilus assembly ATPase PilB-like protein/RNA polymerase subunit RPABC4/transcription elongation factor Spt4